MARNEMVKVGIDRIYGYRVCELKKVDIEVGSLFKRRIRNGFDLGASVGLFKSFEDAHAAFNEAKKTGKDVILFFDPFSSGRLITIADYVGRKEGWINSHVAVLTTNGMILTGYSQNPEFVEGGAKIWEQLDESIAKGTFRELSEVRNEDGHLRMRKIMKYEASQGRPLRHYRFWSVK